MLWYYHLQITMSEQNKIDICISVNVLWRDQGKQIGKRAMFKSLHFTVESQPEVASCSVRFSLCFCVCVCHTQLNTPQLSLVFHRHNKTPVLDQTKPPRVKNPSRIWHPGLVRASKCNRGKNTSWCFAVLMWLHSWQVYISVPQKQQVKW